MKIQSNLALGAAASLWAVVAASVTVSVDGAQFPPSGGGLGPVGASPLLMPIGSDIERDWGLRKPDFVLKEVDDDEIARKKEAPDLKAKAKKLSKQASKQASSAAPQKLIESKPKAPSKKAAAKVGDAGSSPPHAVLLPALSVVLGTMATYHLNNVQDLPPVLSSSIVALAAGIFLPNSVALCAQCGSFAGMASEAVVPTTNFGSATLGLMTALVLFLFDSSKALLGLGGRLGTIAQLGCSLLFLLRKYLLDVRHAPTAILYASKAPKLDNIIDQLPLVVLATCAGSAIMTMWKELIHSNMVEGKDSDSIVTKFFQGLSGSPAAVAITGMLFTLAASNTPLSPAAVGPAYCGGFVAMSSPTKLPTVGSMLLAASFAAIAQVLMADTVFIGGWGGKLGTAALLGVLSYRGVAKITGSDD